jgi:hypothetical protein
MLGAGVLRPRRFSVVWAFWMVEVWAKREDARKMKVQRRMAVG